MAYYECVYLARQDIASSQVDALTDSFAEIIANGGGEVKKREYWGLRNLAYRVKKNRKAHYVLLNIDAPPEALHEMQRIMRLNDDVLRDLTLRVDELDDGPSTMMQRREERRDRGERRSSRDDRGDRGGDRGSDRAGDRGSDRAGDRGSDRGDTAEARSDKDDAEKTKPAAEAKSADDAKSGDDTRPAEDAKPADAAKPAEDTRKEGAE